MIKDNANITFGQRISSKENFNIVPNLGADWILFECTVNPHTDLNETARAISHAQSRFVSSQVIPVIDIDFLACTNSLSQILDELALVFKNHKTIVVAADEDNQAIRLISPRNPDEESRNWILLQLEKTISFFVNKDFSCFASLTVEELCPGGIDPTMGISLARRFVEAGASGLIASGGTIDFPHLKSRRKTTMKSNAEIREWPEMWLSSAHWLVSLVDVPVFAQGPVDNIESSKRTASQLGIHGIISSSVSCPSSNLSMVDSNKH